MKNPDKAVPFPPMTEAVRRYHQEIAEEKGTTREAVVSDYFDETEPTSLIRRMIEPEEVAETVAFLLDPAASAVTGAAIPAPGRT